MATISRCQNQVRFTAKYQGLLEGKLKSVTLSLNPSGEYYAACLYDDGKDKPVSSSEGKAIGLEGINHYAITSDGTKHGNPKYYRKYEVKLAKRQKQLRIKQKGSSNRNKARIKVAKVPSNITRCREDFLQKLSRKLVDENFRHSCRKSGS
jgi:putative transposase